MLAHPVGDDGIALKSRQNVLSARYQLSIDQARPFLVDAPHQITDGAVVNFGLRTPTRRYSDKPRIVVATRRPRLGRPDSRGCRARSTSRSRPGSDRRRMQRLHERKDFEVTSHHLLSVI